MSEKAVKIAGRYNYGWVTPIQLKKYVELSALTPAEYKEICGQDYVA